MAKKSNIKLLGLMLIVIGGGLGFWGYQESRGFGSQLTNALSGSYSDEVMLMLIGGSVLFIAGGYLFFRK